MNLVPFVKSTNLYRGLHFDLRRKRFCDDNNNNYNKRSKTTGLLFTPKKYFVNYMILKISIDIISKKCRTI